MNYFAPATAARRFARGRPYFHPFVINRISEFLSLTDPVRHALDVGCGTGLSSVALRRIAASVTGVDASPEMLSLAPKTEGIDYVIAKAEQLPLRHATFEMMTLSQVFHWLDSSSFFSEARRVLRTEGWLVAYDNYLSGEMEQSAGFEDWFRNSYKERYPRPVRAWTTFDENESEREGFRLLSHEWHPNTIRLTREGLADYLISQSNVIAAVEGGSENAEEVKNWILESTAPFFGDTEAAGFSFDAPIWVLQKIDRH